MTTDNKTLPLWKKLNEQRTQGEWKSAMSGGQVWANNEKTICTLETVPLKITKEVEANAQYTALCVNNMDKVADALDTALKALRDLVKQLPMDERLADYNLDYCELAEQKAMDAFKAIS